MVIVNRTPYPDAEVKRIVLRGARGVGPKPARVVVLYRTLPNDNRLGFTPYDKRKPMEMWVEPANRYPQRGAKSWQDELLQSTLHEMHHYRHPGCHGNACEKSAEAYAQHWRRRLA